MDIAALSIGLSQASLSQNVGIALAKTVMDTSQQNAGEMLEMIQAPHPDLGHTMDLKG